MSFEIGPASKADAPALTEVFLAAFDDDFNRTMFPPTPDVRAFASENLLTSDNENEIILKATASDDPSTMVAFAKWIRPGKAHTDADHPQGAVWPASSDSALCDLFFGTMSQHHKELMDGRPHYYLEILGVHPNYQRRGLASRLLKWGLERADQDGVEVYLSSSPEGKPMYEKYGFQSQNSFSPFPGYVQLNMIRPVQQ
ncbi:hypothetical protein N7492_001417 [Penicillium capsulatum]|uniref:N-acetyltransferase domain-containing protein n=1 Tax=Penicillium capsulatum TaxID=69766 RepID=A0A9W9IUN3_9EURO|nr:hypothetical protein N7492_001417 [Penicillium capsulatum]KAJ6129527.1 hypothetical protein N7512_002307 [Penicillium capsulatum]